MPNDSDFTLANSARLIVKCRQGNVVFARKCQMRSHSKTLLVMFGFLMAPVPVAVADNVVCWVGREIDSKQVFWTCTNIRADEWRLKKNGKLVGDYEVVESSDEFLELRLKNSNEFDRVRISKDKLSINKVGTDAKWTEIAKGKTHGGDTEPSAAQEEWIGSWKWEVNIALQVLLRPTEASFYFDSKTKTMVGRWYVDSCSDAGRHRAKMKDVEATDTSVEFTICEVYVLGLKQVSEKRCKLVKSEPGSKKAELFELIGTEWKKQEYDMAFSSPWF